MNIDKAANILRNHYQADSLDCNQIHHDAEHWESVLGQPDKFPHADCDFIDQFLDAAYSYLGGLSHTFAVE